MSSNAASLGLIVGALLWMIWPFLGMLGLPAPASRIALAMIVLLLLAALVLYARREQRLLAVGGALIAVAGLTIVLAAATVPFWMLPTEAASPGLQTVVGTADAAGMLALYLGGLLVGLARRSGSGAERRAATLLIAAAPAAGLLAAIAALAGLPFGAAVAGHWPIGAALLALGLASRSATTA
ncbi:MAG: hypothetical protein RMM58_14645 [Chloroflexota bacterium]|nr:hypothetical protein [Dehalococcoidia bacterium]MDW8255112.1 hypothetical protein [Chloroflexota bacterium]